MAHRRAKKRRSRRAEWPGKSRGSELLERWRKRRGLDTVQTCVVLGINESALFAFLAGRAAPGKRRKERIDRATHGEVPTESWLTPAAAGAEESQKRARAA